MSLTATKTENVGIIVFSDMTAAIHTEHLSHAFTTERDVEPIVVLEDINVTLPIGSRTILVAPHILRV